MGSHRRQRANPRPSRAAAWTGLFLVLAVAAVVATRGLWSDLVAGLFNLGPVSAPQGSVLWQAPCSPGSMCSVSSAGEILLAGPIGGPVDGNAVGEGGGNPTGAAGAGGAETCLSLVSDAETTTILTRSGTSLAIAFFDPALTDPVGGLVYSLSDWRAITVRAVSAGDAGAGAAPGGEGGGAGGEEVFCHEPSGGRAPLRVTEGAIVTAACPWADEIDILVGLFSPGLSGDPQGSLAGFGPGGEELWSCSMGEKPVHRVAARPGTGLIAVATPDTIALLDGHGNLLWTKTQRTDVTDLAMYSRGGPVVVAGNTLLVYDRRGNLIWKKVGRTPFRAVACAAQRIAVAGEEGVVVYDEDGLEKWVLTCAEAVRDIALDPEGRLLAVVLESGAVMLAQAPGTTTPQ